MDQTGQSIANEVLLADAAHEGPVLLVEGDSDEKLFKRFLTNPDTLVIPAWGKENVLDAIEILESCQAEKPFLGIVDADFGHVDRSLPVSKNVVVTDDHDVEMMIIRTKAFGAVLRELSSSTKVQHFATGTGHGVRHELMQRALILGHFRHLSLTDDLRLRFEGLRFERFIDRNTLDVDVKTLVVNVLALTCDPVHKTKSLHSQLLEKVRAAEEDPYQICCGHDFLAILGIALRRALGSKSREAACPEGLAGCLRLAYDSEDFRSTDLYASAESWSEEHIGCGLFR